MSTDIATWVLATLGILAVIGGILKLGWKKFRQLDVFFDDWFGSPAREGVPKRPGVMVRLENVEQTVIMLKQELSFNHGTTIKDAVHRIDETLQEVQNEQRRGGRL